MMVASVLFPMPTLPQLNCRGLLASAFLFDRFACVRQDSQSDATKLFHVSALLRQVQDGEIGVQKHGNFFHKSDKSGSGDE